MTYSLLSQITKFTGDVEIENRCSAHEVYRQWHPLLSQITKFTGEFEIENICSAHEQSTDTMTYSLLSQITKFTAKVEIENSCSAHEVYTFQRLFSQHTIYDANPTPTRRPPTNEMRKPLLDPYLTWYTPHLPIHPLPQHQLIHTIPTYPLPYLITLHSSILLI
jgi:hypothetical protein